MNRTSIAIVLCLIFLPFSVDLAQTPDAKQEEQLLALTTQIRAQQAQIAENQAKIDSKLAELAASIRVARIYSKREK
jgi:cytochrome c-type biogenesis protein CcmH/NrfF